MLASLLDPVAVVLREGAATLGVEVPHAEFGDVPDFWAVQGDAVVLDRRLLGPDVFHPSERQDWPIDRWRRAAVSLLEAAVWRTLPESVAPWLRLGLAIDRVDAACPALGVADGDILSAIEGADWLRQPRGGVVAARMWRRQGIAPPIDVRDPAVWLAIGRWLFDAQGARAGLQVSAKLPPAYDVPTQLTPWSWRRLAIPAHPRGGQVAVVGAAAVEPGWAVADAPYEGLAAAIGEARLIPAPGGPIGRWILRTAEGFAQVFGARGMLYAFTTGGQLRLEFADAFIGPLSALEESERVGTSGTALGRWAVSGANEFRLSRIDSSSLITHGRKSRDMALPVGEYGMGAILTAMQEQPWRWEVSNDSLRLYGRVMGRSVEMRFLAEAAVGSDA